MGHFDWTQLIEQYGYLAVLVGTFLEGETILVIAGYAAHNGHLRLPWVILAAFAGSFTGDQTFFFIGRFWGGAVLKRFPTLQGYVIRLHSMMDRWRSLFILGFRFLYGLRTVSPFVLGTSNVSVRRFFVLNMVGAIVWAAAISTAGYALGEVLERFLGRAKEYQVYVFLGIGVLGVLIHLALRLRARRRESASPTL